MVLASAYAHELPHYGLKVGLTNYAAAYCTGLLLARRVLKMIEMDEEYQGNVEAIGEDFSVEPAESRRPFCVVLDVDLIRITTGNRVFGALKLVVELEIQTQNTSSSFDRDGLSLLNEQEMFKKVFGEHRGHNVRLG